jgi:hypothetical protein
MGGFEHSNEPWGSINGGKMSWLAEHRVFPLNSSNMAISNGAVLVLYNTYSYNYNSRRLLVRVSVLCDRGQWPGQSIIRVGEIFVIWQVTYACIPVAGWTHGTSTVKCSVRMFEWTYPEAIMGSGMVQVTMVTISTVPVSQYLWGNALTRLCCVFK